MNFGKILVVHNEYRLRGGEEVVCQAEIDLLRKNGHEVLELRRSNSAICAWRAFGVLAGAVWSKRTVSEVDALVTRWRPDVVHVHNTFPLISPSIYWAASQYGLPVIQTLHNFRLLCPQAMLLRNGDSCESCVGKVPWRAVVYRCYRRSYIQSAMVAATVQVHRVAGTWQNKVTRYIALNEFCRQKFIEGGIPADKIRVKPNFVESAPLSGSAEREGFVYVGRLAPEKGLPVLLDAISLKKLNTGMAVIGTGPLAGVVKSSGSVDFKGELSQSQVRKFMSCALALVLPSIWVESFPRTIVEAFSCGLPVIASRLGSLAELVEDGVTGILFDPGNPKDLAEKLDWAASNRLPMARMGKNARLTYESRYSADSNYALLLDIYRDASASLTAS